MLKDIYPQEYMDNWEEFNQTFIFRTLYSSLNVYDLTVKDYQ